MFLDSHAHYTHNSFLNSFRYLAREGDSYVLKEGTLPDVLEALAEHGILCSVEPGITIASNEKILAFARAHPGRVFPAVGVHPTRCIHESWADGKKLLPLAREQEVIAIGETGLDFHHKREDQHRLKQYLWFFRQLGLARRVNKPLILHVRNAHRQALGILRIHPARKQGGVIHCFTGTAEEAAGYIALGFHLGIGGAALQQEDRATELWEAIRQTPLERILLETDAPYVLPYCKDVIAPKQLRRARNTSLILPAVAGKIAELKGVSPETVARVTAENAVRLFSLPVSLRK